MKYKIVSFESFGVRIELFQNERKKRFEVSRQKWVKIQDFAHFIFPIDILIFGAKIKITFF